MTEVQAAEMLVILQDLRRLFEVAQWAIGLCAGLLALGVFHRLTRGR